MDLQTLQQHWEAFAATDPLWAIRTDPTKRGGKWELEAFFADGRAEIATVMASVDRVWKSMPRRRALDFGCGVGRLTQALCEHFDECDGVDISPSMITLADTYNRYAERCRYHLNERNDLTLFPDNSFDFVNTALVLQHMEPQYSAKYLAEFLRVLAPGGLLVFQLPAGRLDGGGAAMLAAESPPRAAQSTEGLRLPAEAFKGNLCPVRLPEVWPAGKTVVVRVRVQNASAVTWPVTENARGPRPINLGNHWLDDSGVVLTRDDGRASLSNDLAPSECLDVDLPVTIPASPGHYRLVLDLVQEEVAWFADRGSAAATVDVVVNESPGADSVEPKLFEPKMEMYFVPEEQVVNLLQAHGGTVLSVETGPMLDWMNARYFVTKESS